MVEELVRGDGTDEDSDGGAPPDRDDGAHDARRRRTARRVLGVGVGVSVVGVAVLGLTGQPGQVAGAVFVALLSLASGLAGATVALGVVVDQFRGRRVSGRRVLMTGGLAILTLLLLIASSGAVAGAVGALT